MSEPLITDRLSEGIVLRELSDLGCLERAPSKRIFYALGIPLFILIMLTSSLAVAEAVKKLKGPIVITSERMTADNRAHTTLFEQSVVARTKDMVLYANSMLVHSDERSGDVTRIDATGDVRLVRDKRLVTSKEATYYAEGEKVIFTGSPKAVENGNVITGKKMTYLVDEDRFLVDDSKVFLPKGE